MWHDIKPGMVFRQVAVQPKMQKQSWTWSNSTMKVKPCENLLDLIRNGNDTLPIFLDKNLVIDFETTPRSCQTRLYRIHPSTAFTDKCSL